MAIEYIYDQRIEVAAEPIVNLFTNPTAEVSLANASSFGLSGFTRQTGSGNLNPNTLTGFRLYGSSSASDTWMNVVGDGNGTIRHGMVPGVEYTVSGTLHQATALSGTQHARRGRIVLFHRIGSGAYTEVLSTQAPNAAGSTRLSITFTLPEGTTEAFFRFYHGIQNVDSVWWHSLMLVKGTDTDYFDGSVGSSIMWGADEYGWDGVAGLSTSWMIRAVWSTPLPDAEFESITYDAERMPMIDATIKVPVTSLPAVMLLPDFDLLDPRRSRDVILYWSVTQYTPTEEGLQYESHLPYMGGAQTGRGKLWLREVEFDFSTDIATLTVSSGEVRFEDKRRVAIDDRDTGATTVADLVRYVAADIGEGQSLTSIDGAATAALPAGDRRKWQAGETANEAFESELAALGLRLYCNDVGRFSVARLDRPPGHSAVYAYLVAGENPEATVTDYKKVVSRERGWADATVVFSKWGDPQQAAAQRDQDGNNWKGQRIDLNRPIAGQGQSIALAQEYTKAAQAKGILRTVSALCDFGIRPGRPTVLAVYILMPDSDEPNSIIRAINEHITPTRITYHPSTGEMTLEG